MLQMFLGRKINPTSRAAGQPGCICREQILFFKALHLEQFPLNPPPTEQKDKPGPSSAMHFSISLTSNTVAATSSGVSPVLPKCLICSEVPNFSTFLFFGFPVQPPSPKTANTAQRICWTSTISCKSNPMNFSLSQLKGQIQGQDHGYLPVKTGGRWETDRTRHEHLFMKKKKRGKLLCFVITKECFTSCLLVSFYSYSPLAQGILRTTRFNS